MKLARHKRSKELVTIKCIKQNTDVLLDKNVEREILNHRRLNHSNILGFREVFATDSHLCIVVEHASAGSLAGRCEGRRMAEAQARQLFAQLLDGLAYCHAQGVYHRDLRVEHILLSGSVYEPVVKISGFGYSKSAVMDSMAKTMVGAKGYMAPEVVMSSGSYDASKTDVWAAGVILYQMLTGRLPFCHDSNASGVLDRNMMQRIMHGQFLLPGDLELSMEAQDVLCRVFRPDPKKRIALAELRKHPWLTKGTSAKLAQGMPAEGRSMQTEEGITDVLQRARQRRLQRRTATHSDAVAGATSSSSLKHIGPASLGTQSMRPGMREE
ncbi:g384 [Coccomyxa viridis]|uniref:G384 protein n=1 Tax=Coccomyxa viridis TaxID=1274662 RepID=A0ABP1FII3_9CHLO